MNSIIAIIGATGKAGTYLVKALIERKYAIQLLLRDPSKFQSDYTKVKIVKGDVRDYHSVLQTLQGCDAIVSALGQPQDDGPVFSTASANIIKAMHELNIKRYIVITGLSIDTPFDQKGTWAAHASLFMRQTYPMVIADKQKEYTLLANSNVNWTMVRVPLIQQTDLKAGVTVSLTDCPGQKISTADLADFLIAQLTDGLYIKQAPFVATK